MMLKMMNPFGSVTDSIPGVGGGDSSDDGISKEEAEEQEKLRQEAIRQAEKERRDKYKKQEEEREGIRQTIRDKVILVLEWARSACYSHILKLAWVIEHHVMVQAMYYQWKQRKSQNLR